MSEGGAVTAELAGKVAVVTGSGGAMGGAIALRLAEHGADVVLNDRLADRAGAMEEPVRALGRDVVTVVGNVTRRPEAHAVVGAAVERWGRVDILVNVVGGIKGPVSVPLWEITEEQWEFAMGLNLRGTFHCTQAALPSMMSRRAGKIVNIASIAWAGEAMHPHYSAAKAGVVAFTRAAASQLGPFNINVNAIAPGGTARNIAIGPLDPSAVPPSVSVPGPLGRTNQPEDIAAAVRFLVSEESRNISGQLLTIAGGNNPQL